MFDLGSNAGYFSPSVDTTNSNLQQTASRLIYRGLVLHGLSPWSTGSAAKHPNDLWYAPGRDSEFGKQLLQDRRGDPGRATTVLVLSADGARREGNGHQRLTRP